MLTVKAPIELKCIGLVFSSGEDFCHRITDNYQMISAAVSGEDLLHLVNTPPEVFLAESGMTSVSNQMNLYHSQENKIEIINNLLNRILVSGEGILTYQDRVYITNTLRKLGITDDRQFMTQVSHIKEEIDNRSKLIDLYWNHSQELVQLVEEYQSHEQNIRESVSNMEQELHLHEDIMNRLQTGAVYQVIRNFSNRQTNHLHLTTEELQLAEQGRTADTILLQRLQSVVRGEEVPLVYRHENYYEQNSLEEENVTRENVTKQMTAAVLLNLIDNLYESRYEQFEAGQDNWYSLENSFYRTAENTLQRFRNELHRNESRTVKQYRQQFVENQSSFYRQETELLTQLFADETEDENNFYSNQPSYSYTDNRTENRYESGRAEREPQEPVRAETEVQMAELVTRTQEEDVTRLTEENITSLKQELDRVNERNEENYRRLIEVRHRAGKRDKKMSAAERREQMRRESLQALRDPVSLMLTYRQEAQEQAEEEKRLSEEISREALPESTRQIYHIMEQYLQQPEIWQQTGAVTVNNINRLQQDIRQADMTVLEQGQAAQQREQAAREIVQEAERAAGNVSLPVTERQYHTQAQENLSFVHRQTTNAVDEELIEQLMEDRRLTEQKNIVTQQTREVNQTVNTHETWQHVQNIEQRNEDVANMVRADVQRQIGAISDQVYSRLEKRLQNEKKRRGL